MDPLLITLLIVIAALALGGLVFAALAFARTRGRDDGALAEVLRGALRDDLATQGSMLRQDLSTQRSELTGHLTLQAQAAGERETALRTTLHEQLAGIRRENAEQLQALAKANGEKHMELQSVLTRELEKLRQENETKLEQMRATVDEKLQGTLEKRLGESFALVSQQLDLVSKGLGEMQNLASDVGGLKRVLTNVKSRGTWGEVQLARQLEDVLTRDQYEQNVAIRPDSNERVEFAVRLPGRAEDEPVYLPLDSKFPREDFDRLQEAQDAGDKIAVDAAAAALERAIVEQAKTISAKYIEPPYSTDFAIMYLPFESLFAEVVRRPGLMERLQRDHRVQIAGPSTLMAYLNSLQMGFRTLAIEQRSSEVWQVLAAAKNEFAKYGQVMDRLKKQLGTAQNTVEAVGTRTRAINRALKRVEVSEITDPLALESLIAGEELEEELAALDSEDDEE